MPRRPALPVSCVYSPGVMSTWASPLNFTSFSSTTVRAGMLMPSARVSVAKTSLRAPVAKPREARSSATRAAVRLVRAKMIVRPRPSAWRMRATTLSSALASALTRPLSPQAVLELATDTVAVLSMMVAQGQRQEPIDAAPDMVAALEALIAKPPVRKELKEL